MQSVCIRLWNTVMTYHCILLALFGKRNRKWPLLVYIALCKHSRKFGRIWKFYNVNRAAWVYINFRILPNFLVCLHQAMLTRSGRFLFRWSKSLEPRYRVELIIEMRLLLSRLLLQRNEKNLIFQSAFYRVKSVSLQNYQIFLKTKKNQKIKKSTLFRVFIFT